MALRHLRVFAACSFLPIVACERKPEVPVDDPQAFVEGAIRNAPELCPFKRAEYCLDDLVAPAIRTELGSAQYKKLEGQLPSMDRKLGRFADSAKRRYRQMHFDDEARRSAVLAKMKKHYEEAPVVRRGGSAYLDLGVLPTGFEKRRAGWGLAGSDSPLLDGFSWRSSEVADQLLRMKTAEPDATSYTIKIEVPRGISTVMLLIAWYPSSQRIAVRDRGKQWATRDPVGERLESLRSADAELFKDLRSCTRRGAVPEECPAPATWPDGM